MGEKWLVAQNGLSGSGKILFLGLGVSYWYPHFVKCHGTVDLLFVHISVHFKFILKVITQETKPICPSNGTILTTEWCPCITRKQPPESILTIVYCPINHGRTLLDEIRGGGTKQTWNLFIKNCVFILHV